MAEHISNKKHNSDHKSAKAQVAREKQRSVKNKVTKKLPAIV